MSRPSFGPTSTLPILLSYIVYLPSQSRYSTLLPPPHPGVLDIYVPWQNFYYTPNCRFRLSANCFFYNLIACFFYLWGVFTRVFSANNIDVYSHVQVKTECATCPFQSSGEARGKPQSLFQHLYYFQRNINQESRNDKKPPPGLLKPPAG